MELLFFRRVSMLIVFAALPAMAGPGFFTYEGYLEDTGGTPVTNASVPMVFTLIGDQGSTSSSDDCTLFQESSSVSVQGGHFAVRLGTSQTPSNFKAVFSNSPSIPGSSCAFDGSTSSARRFVTVSVAGVSMGSIVLSSAPMAVIAAKADDASQLGGIAASGYVQTSQLAAAVPANETDPTVLSFAKNPISGLSSGACPPSQVLTVSGGVLTCVADAQGAAPGVATASTTGVVKIGSSLSVDGTGLINVVAGAGDLSGSYPNLQVAGIRGMSVASTPASSGQLLLSNGSAYSPSYVGLAQLRNNAGTLQLPTACTSDKTLTWGTHNDVLNCSPISITASQTSDFNTAADTRIAADTTKLAKSGGTMTGALDMGSQNLTNVSFLTMSANRTLHLSNNASDPTGLVSGDAGKMWYNGGQIKYWNGASTQVLGVAGAGITNLNGLSSSSQSFATPGTSGTAPNWNSATSTHTLNIPMANTSSVTAGLISKTEFDAFNSKLGAVTNTASLASGKLWIGDGSGKAQELTLSNDVTIDNAGLATIANSAVTPAKIAANAVTSTKILDGAVTTPKLFSNPGVNRLVATDASTGATLAAINCGVGQILVGSAATGFSCDTVSNNIPTGSGGFLKDGGNSTGGNISVGTNDGNNLVFETSNSARMTIDAAGRIGVGTGTPSSPLHVADSYSGSTPRPSALVRQSYSGQAENGSFAFGSSVDVDFTYGGSYSGANDGTKAAAFSTIGAVKTSVGNAFGGQTSLNAESLRNNDSGFNDSGTFKSLLAGRFRVAHEDKNGSATPTTSEATGISIEAEFKKGTLGQYTALRINSPSVAGGVTVVSTPIGIRQEGSQMVNLFDGKVGIGSYNPVTKLDVAGAVRLGNDASACDGAHAGSLRYNASVLELCNGASWNGIASAGAGIQSLNGQTAATQTFATPGTSGTAPGWSSGGGNHTLNIPMANSSGVTAGLISKTDYDAFTAKLGSVAGSTLNSGQVWIGSAGNLATPQSLGGDVSMVANGTVTIAAGAVTAGKLANNSVATPNLFTNPGVNRLVATDGSTGAGLSSLACSTADHVLKWTVATGWQCDAVSNILPVASAGGFIKDGGNSLGAVMTIGTSDNNNFKIKTNSGDRLTIDTAGKVGIGTTNPQDDFHVKTGSTTAGLRFENNGGNYVQIYQGASDAIVFRTPTPKFFTMMNNGTFATEKLQMSYGAAAGALLKSDASGNASWGTLSMGDLPSNVIYNGGNSFGSGMIIGTTDSQGLDLRTGGMSRINIDSLGNVGIGTPAGAPFHTNSTVTSNGSGQGNIFAMTLAPTGAHGGNSAVQQVQLFSSGANTINQMNAQSLSVSHSSSPGVSAMYGTDSSVMNMGAATISAAGGLRSRVQNSSTGTITTSRGVESIVAQGGTGTSMGTAVGFYADVSSTGGGGISNATGVSSSILVSSGNTITTAYGISSNFTNAGTITNSRGISSTNPLSGANHYNIYADGTAKNYFESNVGIGTTTPGSLLHVNGTATVSSLATPTVSSTGTLSLTSTSATSMTSNGSGAGAITLSTSTASSGITLTPHSSGVVTISSGTGLILPSGATVSTTSGNLNMSAVAGSTTNFGNASGASTTTLASGTGGTTISSTGTTSTALTLSVSGTAGGITLNPNATGQVSVNGKTKLGSSGTAFTNMGACTITGVTPTNNITAIAGCSGLPASGVAVHCSHSVAFTTATTVMSCRPSGTAGSVICTTSAANSAAGNLLCMWVQP